MARSALKVVLLAAVLGSVRGLTSSLGCACTGACNANGEGLTLAQPTSGGNQNFCTTTSGCGYYYSSILSFWWDYCTPPAYSTVGNTNCYLSSNCLNSCPSGSSCMNEDLNNCLLAPTGYDYTCINQWEQGVGGRCYLDSGCLNSCGSGSTCIDANGLFGNPNNCASTDSGYNYICITPSAVVVSNGVNCYLSNTCQSACGSGYTCTDDSGLGGSCYGAGTAAGWNKYACNAKAPSPPPPATPVTSISNSPSFVLSGIPSALGSTTVNACTGAFYLVTGGAVLSPGTTCSGNSGGTGPNAQQNVYATMTGSCFVHQGPNYSIILVQGAQDMLLCDNNGAMYAPNTGASTFPASVPAVSSWYYYSGSAWTPVTGTSFNVAINAPSPISSPPPPPPAVSTPSPQYVSGPCTSDATCSAACSAYNLCSGGNSCPGAWSSSSSGNIYSCLCGATGLSSTTITPTCRNLAGSPPPPPPPVSSPPPPPPRKSPPPYAPSPSYSPIYSASPAQTPSSAIAVRAAGSCVVAIGIAVIVGI